MTAKRKKKKRSWFLITDYGLNPQGAAADKKVEEEKLGELNRVFNLGLPASVVPSAA